MKSSGSKKARHQAIKEIVKTYDIETQEEIVAHLREQGFDVTQATVSRDVRELKLTRVSTGVSMRYSIPAEPQAGDANKYRQIFSDIIISVEPAGNLIVLKTLPGMAQPAAVAVENVGGTEVVGAIAGDDTVFIAFKCEEKAKDHAEFIKIMLQS